MNLNFSTALQALGPTQVFDIANATRPPAWYLWNMLLPESNFNTYNIDQGSMTVRSTMAGLAATDSPYPPTGVTEVSTFMEDSAKIANYSILPERAVRRIQADLAGLGMQNSQDYVVNEVLNYLDKVIVQGHIDVFEWLRGEAIQNGALAWNFNQMNLVVDYGIPAANVLTTRTGDDTWDGSTSQFWTDIRLLQAVLQYNVRAFILHPSTLTKIIDNSVNDIEMVQYTDHNNGTQSYTFRRLLGANERISSDFRDTITLIAYGLEGEVLDPSEASKTKIVPFMQEGKIVAIGNNRRNGYRVGEGSTDDPEKDKALGYTHIAPTVEGGGAPGRWAQLFTPEDMPMQLHGRGVTNGLPVIEAPAKIAIATSDLT